MGVTCNKNLIPFDKQPPMKASGVRLGTPAITTRGLGKSEMKRLGILIADVLRAQGNEAIEKRAAREVAELAAAFPIRAARVAV